MTYKAMTWVGSGGVVKVPNLYSTLIQLGNLASGGVLCRNHLDPTVD